MADTALYAAYAAIQAAFTAAGITNHKPDLGSTGMTRPFYTYFWTGGGETNRMTIKDDANLLIGIKCVADTLSNATTGSLIGAQVISGLFNNKGIQDVTSGALNAGSTWAILVTKQETVIHVVENITSTTQRYHDGHIYRFIMEKIP